MCLNDDIFIRLLNGQATVQQREEWETHLAGCSACAERYGEFRQVHDLLGQWDVTVPEGDLTGAVLAAASQARPAVAGSLRWWGSAAAVLIVAAGVGAAAGMIVPQRPMRAEVTEERLVEAVGLDALASDAGLLEELFAPPADETGKERAL